ncbi:MAG: hypothetical protein JJU22_10000 [Gammaproteobacteria bacterium]|jgi:hypothetical protein|nr:hypothetical protein [Gammaproteobacteria bacterium]
MAAILMALVLAVVFGGIVWLLLGNRFELDADVQQNEILNLGLYVAITFVPVFILILIWSP